MEVPTSQPINLKRIKTVSFEGEETPRKNGFVLKKILSNKLVLNNNKKRTLGVRDEVDLHEAHVTGGEGLGPVGTIEGGVGRGQISCTKRREGNKDANKRIARNKRK